MCQLFLSMKNFMKFSDVNVEESEVLPDGLMAELKVLNFWSIAVLHYEILSISPLRL